VSAVLPPASERSDAGTLGMWLFLAGELLFFGGLFAGYAIGRLHSPAGFAAAGVRTDLLLGTLNTAVLLTSSFVIAIAADAAAAHRARAAVLGFAGAALLGLVFVAVKAVEYRGEWHEGLFPGPGFSMRDAPQGAELFFMWYFSATALHALHLVIGMLMASGCALAQGLRAPAWLRALDAHAVALYWHFVDVVWIFLFPAIYLVAPRA